MNKNIVISKNKASLKINGKPIKVHSTKTFNLIYLFANNKDRLLSRDKILSNVWDGEMVTSRSVDIQITKIRRIIGKDAIETIKGRGYKLVTDIEVDDDLSDINTVKKIEDDDIVIYGTYSNSKKNHVVVTGVAESKYGDLVIFAGESKLIAMTKADFKAAYKMVK